MAPSRRSSKFPACPLSAVDRTCLTRTSTAALTHQRHNGRGDEGLLLGRLAPTCESGILQSAWSQFDPLQAEQCKRLPAIFCLQWLSYGNPQGRTACGFRVRGAVVACRSGAADEAQGSKSDEASGIDRTPTVAIATGGAPRHEDDQAGTIGYFFLRKFSITVWSRGKCAWSNCGGVSAIHWLSERSAK